MTLKFRTAIDKWLRQTQLPTSESSLTKELNRLSQELSILTNELVRLTNDLNKILAEVIR